jgi:purine-binding chemotaxis protein CheW
VQNQSYSVEFNNEERPESSNGLFALRGELDGKDQNEQSNLTRFIGIKAAKDELLFPLNDIAEIIMFQKLTFVPRSPKHVLGVINLRGQILPAISLRSVFGLEKCPDFKTQRIVISRLNGLMLGLLVDAITNVIPIAETDVQPHTMSGQVGRSQFISSVAKRENNILGVLDIRKIISEVTEGDFLVSDDNITEVR